MVGRPLLVGALLVLGAPAGADEAPWYLMDRHEGCVDLNVLVQRERLSRVPTSPEDFARMMRSRGYTVAVGSVPNTPPHLVGKLVLVDVRDDLKPVFVQKELCRQIDR